MSLLLDSRPGHHVKRVEQELIAAKSAVLRPLGLNVPQYTVLVVLREEPGLSSAALARRCMVTPQTMSTVLGTLESKGMVQRASHPVHAHVYEARLTRRGRALLDQADEVAVEIEQRLIDSLGDDWETLTRLLGRCSTALASAPVR